jgi:hypothetical protein
MKQALESLLHRVRLGYLLIIGNIQDCRTATEDLVANWMLMHCCKVALTNLTYDTLFSISTVFSEKFILHSSTRSFFASYVPDSPEPGL